MLENDTLNVVDEQTGRECTLSHSARTDRGREPRDEDEAGSRAGASGQRPGDQTDLSGWRRHRHHRECQPHGRQRHPRLGQSRRCLHDRLQRSQSKQNSRGALVYLVHLHDQLGEDTVFNLYTCLTSANRES